MDFSPQTPNSKLKTPLNTKKPTDFLGFGDFCFEDGPCCIGSL